MTVDGAVGRGRPGTGRGPATSPSTWDDLFEAMADLTGSAEVRSLVSESWERSLAAAIDPSLPLPPMLFDRDESHARLAAHPMNAVMPLLRENLVKVAEEAMHVLIVTDENGTVLWREGANSVLDAADESGLVEGSSCAEEAIGTNAMGTTLAVGRPVQIHSAEHLIRRFHVWSCVAAPVRDPDTGRLIGAVDITGPRTNLHPALLALVTATAQLAENQMRLNLAIADERLRLRNLPHLQSLHGSTGALVTPTGRVIAAEPYGAWPERLALADLTSGAPVRLGDGREMQVEPLAEGFLLRAARRSARVVPTPRHALSLHFLGEGAPRIVLDGRTHTLTLRPAEILTVLALHPSGLTGERLAQLLYGDDGNQTTVRGEIHRLRALIGTDVLKTRPYRLDATVDTDFGTVRRALHAGRVPEALRSCAGALLPRSDAPEIRAVRDELEVGLRRAILESDDAELLAEFTDHPLGRDDIEAHERLAAMLPVGDPRRGIAQSRVARLLAD